MEVSFSGITIEELKNFLKQIFGKEIYPETFERRSLEVTMKYSLQEEEGGREFQLHCTPYSAIVEVLRDGHPTGIRKGYSREWQAFLASKIGCPYSLQLCQMAEDRKHII